MAAPLVSVVVPTRNRPELLKYALRSLLDQSFADFEVIVCDNHTGTSSQPVFDANSDARFRYVVPPAPLAMHDNWEYACGLARGTYVTVLIDKTVLRPSALQMLSDTVSGSEPDIVSWWAEGYKPSGGDPNAAGEYWPLHATPRASEFFDPRHELARRFAFDVRRGEEGIHYYRGKICFGAYHRDLIARIKAAVGRLFFPLNPDYTSMTAALALSHRAIDVCEPLLMQFITEVSNGATIATWPDRTIDFIRGADPADTVMHRLPLPNFYTSVHNLVAFDYATMQQRLRPTLDSLSLDMPNLTLRAAEDFVAYRWEDDKEEMRLRKMLEDHKREFWAGMSWSRRNLYRWRLSSYVARMAWRTGKAQIIRRFPELRTLRQTMKRTVRQRRRTSAAPTQSASWRPVASYRSILDAARAADDYFASAAIARLQK